MAYLRQCLLELRALERHATTIDFVDAPVTGAAAALYALRAAPVATDRAADPSSARHGLERAAAAPTKT